MWGTFEQAQSYLWGDVYVEGVSEATSINATITGDLFMMPAGPLAFAATFEDSDTNYNIDPGPQYDAGMYGELLEHLVVVKEPELHML